MDGKQVHTLTFDNATVALDFALQLTIGSCIVHGKKCIADAKPIASKGNPMEAVMLLRAAQDFGRMAGEFGEEALQRHTKKACDAFNGIMSGFLAGLQTDNEADAKLLATVKEIYHEVTKDDGGDDLPDFLKELLG